MKDIEFEWDPEKDRLNKEKHSVSFAQAIEAFNDPDRIIAHDEAHSIDEQRWFCIGKISKGVVTVRCTVRENKIRIIGAAMWRKGRKIYEKRRRHIH